MAAYLRLKSSEGHWFYVNPAHVQMLTLPEEGQDPLYQTLIHLAGGRGYWTSEYPPYVALGLGKAAVSETVYTLTLSESRFDA